MFQQHQAMKTRLGAVAIPLTESGVVNQNKKKESRVEFSDFRNKLQGKGDATVIEAPKSLLQRVMHHAFNGGDELYMVDHLHVNKYQTGPKPFYTLRDAKALVGEKKVYNLPKVNPTVAKFESF